MISEQQWMLRNAIMLDGFLKAVDDSLLKEDAKCNIEVDLNNIPEVEEIFGETNRFGSKKVKDEDSKFELWDLCAKHILWFFENLEAGYTDRENESRTVELKKYVSRPFLFTKKYATERFNALNMAYEALIGKLDFDDGNKKLYNALTLFHINRYTYIIDLYLMDNFNDTDFPFFRIGGLFTSIVLHWVFSGNGSIIKAAFADACVENDKEISAIEVSGDLSVIHFKEREIVFVNELIEKISQLYKKTMFVAERCEADNDMVYTDYRKIAEFFEAFAKDEILQMFLDEIEIPEAVYAVYGNNYRRIYDTLKKNNNEENFEI